MRKTVLVLTLLISMCATAQEVVRTPNNIYTEELVVGQRYMPYPFLRGSDVVWSTMLWKTIDLNEDFNQYMYFPIDDNDRSGKKSLAYVIWDAVAANEIPIYEDDELKIPVDNLLFVEKYTKADTIQLEIGYDDDDNELYETIIQPNDFDGAEIFRYALREVWFIGKQDTRQDSRRMALAPMKEMKVKFGNTEELINLGIQPLFWIPMQNPIVRTLFAKNSSFFDEQNAVGQPTWDYIFISQLYSAYVTKESNKYGRSISKYLTGEDALIEAASIEERVFNIGSDMWEY